MKFTTQQLVALDQKIEKSYDLHLPNSAFKRVIPSAIKSELRQQYFQAFEEQRQEIQQFSQNITTSRSVSPKIVRLNIAELREAGYCICQEELAAQCEEILRAQESKFTTEKSEELNVLTEKLQFISKKNSSETVEIEMESDTDTTDEKLEVPSTTVSKVNEILAKKAYPSKVDKGEFKKSKVSAKQQKRTTKRKYFTKYMSDEFCKDTKPVNMSMMDSKTQYLFQSQNFNELVSEITGIN